MPFAIFSQETEAIEIQQEIEQEIDIEEIHRRIFDEDPAELMSMSLGDNNVSLELSGSWKGLLQGNIGVIHSPLGNSLNSPETPLLFSQEADILLSLWINNKWFLEANLQDDSSQNTYRAGFQGGQGDFIQYMGIGNTGLDFPAFPYLDLGGDSSSSFGFYGRMGTDNLSIHSLFRYDMASREERVFTGSRERTISYIQPDNYIRGVSFVLPETNINTDIIVYIEDEKGTIIDTDRRKRWRKLQSSEYAVGSREGLLELNIRPAGMVAVYYNGINTDVDNYISGIPAVFIPYLTEPEKRSVSINGDNALVVYEPGIFSPFERKSRYDSPSSSSEQADFIYLSSGAIIQGYELVSVSESSQAGDIPLFIQSVSQRTVYELYSKESVSRRDAKSIWPLLDIEEYKEIYFPVNNIYTGDAYLRFTNYSGVQGYFLGTDVVKGSVQVWRSGIQDSNFRFNESSGEVILNSSAGQNEIVRITFLRKSNNADIGSIAAGAGAVYRKGESPFSASLAVGTRWNVIEQEAFTEEGSNSIGSVGISAKTQWEYDNLKAHIAAGFAFEQTDTTGLYRAAGMEGHKVIIPLPGDTSFASHAPKTLLALGLTETNRAELIYKNYYNNNVLGTALMPVTWNGFTVVSGMDKPYPVKDPEIKDAQILVADFILTEGKDWTGFQVPLGTNSDFISRAAEIIIPYRLNINSGIADLKLIVQIGNLSSKDYYFNENINLIWEQELINYKTSETPNGWQSEIFKIDDDNLRNKLSKADYLRIIAVSEGTAVAGQVFLASPVIHGAAFKPLNPGIIVYETAEIGGLTDNFTEIKRLHPKGSVQNRVLAVEWNALAEGIPAGADGRIGEIPLNDYREISFFARLPVITDEDIIENGSFNFIIASGPEIKNEYLSVSIPLSGLSTSFGDWKKITIRYQGDNKGVFVNGKKIIDDVSYKPVKITSQSNPVNFVRIYIDPKTSNSLGSDTMYIDEIILEDPCIVNRINAGAAVEYTKQGTILSLSGVTALSDFKISSAVESEIRINENTEESEITGSVINRSGLDISVFGVQVETNAAFIAGQELFYWSADHSISKTAEAFSFKESFSASPYDNSAQHSVSLSFSPSVFYSKLDADANYELSRLNQKWNFGIGFNPKNELIPALDFLSSVSYINTHSDIKENDDYANLWIQSFESLVPDAGKGANVRRSVSRFSVNQRTKPIGAVFTLEGITNFTAVNNLTQTENSLYLDIPVNLSRSSINFRMGRGFKRYLTVWGNDIFDEGSLFFASVTESLPLWSVFPGFSLFADELNNAMDKVSPAQFVSFNDHFSTAVTLPRRSDLFSFVIPSKGTFRLERIVERKMDTKSDILNLGAGLNYSAINMFGSMGYLPLFKFYQNDEFNSSILGAVVFNEEISWRFQSVIGTGFRTQLGTLNAVNTFTIRNEGYWLESFILEWITPANKILIDLLYNKISGAVLNQKSWPGLPSLLSTDYQKLRKESIELIIDNETDYIKWNLLIGHEEIIRVLQRLEFTGFTKVRFSEDKYKETFLTELLIGITLRVSF